MTAPLAGGMDRGTRATRPTHASSDVTALAVLLVAGLALRLIIAYVLAPGGGFETDLRSFAGWALTLAERGPSGFYRPDEFADYTPGYLYVLALLGGIAKAVAPGDPGSFLAGTPGEWGGVLKLPAILADIALAYLLYRMVRHWMADDRRARAAALGAAAIYLFNPITWYDSAVWGQVDSVGSLVMLASLALLVRGHSEGATAMAVLAGLIKPQFGIVMVPIVGAVLLRRHLFKPGSGPRPEGRASWPREWVVEEQGPWRILSSIAVGLVVMFIVITPFGLGPIQLVQRVIATAAGYNWVSVNAFNPWALVGIGEPSLATSGYLAWSDDRLPLLFGIPAVVIGAILLAAGFLAGFLALLRDDSRRSIVVATIFLSLAFFVLPTRVHERYLFPAFAFLPLLAVVSSRWGIALVVLSVSAFINFHGVLTAGQYATPELRDLPLGSTFRTTPFIVLSVLGHLGVFLFAAYRLGLGRSLFRRRRIVPDAAEPDPWLVPDTTDEPEREVRGYDGSLRRRGFPSPARASLAAASVGGSAGALSGALPDDLPAWREEIGRGDRVSGPAAFATLDDDDGRAGARGFAGGGTGTTARWPDDEAATGPDEGTRLFEPAWATAGAGAAAIPVPARGRGFLRGFLGRFDTPSLRRDRSEQLRHERGGRFQRLDVFIVVLLMLAALGSRTWRLEEPYDMHFDEVYHARTATEFLQDWRYDIPHSIYEFTHPHLAKYLIAAGLVAFGNDRVTAESQLSTTVEDAAIETRWSTREQPELRNGDRLYVATGSDVRVYDLADRGLVATIASPAVAVAVGDDSHTLYLADAAGRVSRVSTLWLDLLREPPLPGEDPIDAEELTPQPMATLGGTPTRLVATPDERAVVGLLDGGRVVSLSTETGARNANITINGGAALTPFESGDTVYVTPTEVVNLDADLRRVAEILDKDAGTLRRQVDEASRRGQERVAIAAFMTKEQRDAIREATGGEELVGIDVEGGNAIAVGDARGVALLDPATLRQLARVDVGAPVTGLVHMTGVDKPHLYAAAGKQLVTIRVGDEGAPSRDQTVAMPATIRDVTWDPATNLIHALGATPDKATAAGAAPGSTIYVVEPHGNAVFADARLPFTEPAAWVVDEQRERPSDDRQEILALASDGRVATVDAGSHAFAWRFPGVIAFTLTAGLLYLLARLLFQRRSVAVILAVLVLVDGMFFAQSRIAMNDSYVTLFIVAAYTVFAAIYLRRWRGWSAALIALPLIGVLLGLALSAKWVGAYAIGGIVLLVLLRSAVGRVIALGAMIGMTGILGYIAWGPDVANVSRNIIFLLLMLGLMVLLSLAMALRPARLTLEEMRFMVVAPGVAGALLAVAALAFGARLPVEGPLTSRTLLLAAIALAALGVVAALVTWLLGRRGVGPLADSPDPDDPRALVEPADPAPASWLRPGWRLGIPWLWAMACLTLLPLAVYVAHYAPWVDLGNQWVAGFPAGREGKQTLFELQRSMYEYHNNLRATHAASSPWWAWAFDMKPVWFYQEGFANDTTGVIYDSGNLVLFWLSIPAVAWTAWQAWSRRSLALTLVVLALACQWLPWARIDRATFQYHVFTSLPFAFMCLAYFLAELWHGASQRTWTLARASAALALIGAPLLWAFRQPLCAIAGTEKVNASGASRVCDQAPWQIQLPAGIQLEGLEVLLVLGLVALLVLAAVMVLRARDPRRFVIGVLISAALWFVAWYPNLSGLPMPTRRANMYQGVLPTYDYDFQFGVNQDQPVALKLIDTWSIALLIVCLAVALAVIYAARSWRLEFALRREREARPTGPLAETL